MLHGISLSKAQRPSTQEERDHMSRIPYASAIGSIMYAMLCTRPDVSYALSMTSRYQSDPSEKHWIAVKNILKYLRRTKEMFLVYGGEEELVFVTELAVVPSIADPVELYCDNNEAIAQAKEPRSHQRSKHILRRFHLIREIVDRGDVKICRIPTDENLADPLTKPLLEMHKMHL
ncbi:hypothetical protein CRG98_012333 [Punica granatum]|uniref:Retrovirus-related Pol polyprotein from transposon TNT 1-94 n=1 Tax=Punica granatum TaxID=22663 RepID=A0A2I0KFH8_PUNGR|nr:hypothetical protein CRG98_012333 [Punica granatum]